MCVHCNFDGLQQGKKYKLVTEGGSELTFVVIEKFPEEAIIQFEDRRYQTKRHRWHGQVFEEVE